MCKQFSSAILFMGCLLSPMYGDAPVADDGTPVEQGVSSDDTSQYPVSGNSSIYAHSRAFTGKIKKGKARMRVYPDVESQVVAELGCNELVMVLDERGDFYAVEPPANVKAYVFRGFVFDGVVQGDRVNVRLEPSLDAPIIGHLSGGDQVEGKISERNNKWYEISLPQGTHFFIAREYVDSIGGPEVKLGRDKRRSNALYHLDMACTLGKVEFEKPFQEIDLDRIKSHYQAVFNDYPEFTELSNKAREGWRSVQEEYMKRKISYLENPASGKRAGEQRVSEAKYEVVLPLTDRMKVWEPIEESLYLSWAVVNEGQSLDAFYEEEKSQAITITGILEAYTEPVKNKPGDFILKKGHLPIAYLYSTFVNLRDFIDQEVTVEVVQRNNNRFAYPSYFVLSLEASGMH